MSRSSWLDAGGILSTSREEHLFASFDSSSIIQNAMLGLNSDLINLKEHEIKGTSVNEWIKFFSEKYSIRVPSLLENEIQGDVQDVLLDARQFPSSFHLGQVDGFAPVAGTEIKFYVPFHGEPLLFRCRGNTIYASFPMAEVLESQIIFSYRVIAHDVEKINKTFDNDLRTVSSHLKSLEEQFSVFNKSIDPSVQAKLSERFEKLKKDEDLGSKLKFPLRKRDAAQDTYRLPEVKRVGVPAPIPAIGAMESPDPTLEMEHYNHILTVVKNMVRVMECSPKAFKELDEENLRFHFLVQLNGQYEGMATGETFNFQGKTDIIIKYSGQNLFVGECKFWKGPKGYTETIDQILNYITWRDTKTAIFIFCKAVDPSVPSRKIPEETEKHPNYIKTISLGDGSSFRFIFQHPGDSSKQLYLSVMVFNIPS
jgi:hypothetical protein